MIYFNILSSNYQVLLNQAKDDGDVTIIVKDDVTNTNDKDDKSNNTFKAHSLILSTQCPWFKTTISEKKKDAENIVIEIPNISPSIFDIILKFIYCGEITLNSLSGKDTLDLLIAMQELQIDKMLDNIQDNLLIFHNGWLQENFFYTYKISLKRNELKKLHQYFDRIIQDQPDVLFFVKDFTKMDKDLLISVIKREDLVMSEIDVWRKLIAWGKEHIRISKSLTDWNEEDFKALNSALDQCIPLIRFTSITSVDYYHEVRPYEKIIPDKIKENIIQYHMTSRVSNSDYSLPPRIGVIDSTLITSMDAAIIATWINKSIKPLKFSEIPFEFKLLLRGSQDGFSSEVFHSKCLNKSNTIVVMRIAGTRKIIGGYNPLEWKKRVEWKPVEYKFNPLTTNLDVPHLATTIGSLGGANSSIVATTSSSSVGTTSSIISLGTTVGPFGFGTPKSSIITTTSSNSFGTTGSNTGLGNFTTTVSPFGGSGTPKSSIITTTSSNSFGTTGSNTSLGNFTTTVSPFGGSGTPKSNIITTTSSNSVGTTGSNISFVDFGKLSGFGAIKSTQPSNVTTASSNTVGTATTGLSTGFGFSSSGFGNVGTTKGFGGFGTSIGSSTVVTTSSSIFGATSTSANARQPLRKLKDTKKPKTSTSTLSTSSASKVISLPNVANVVQELQDLADLSTDTEEQKNFDFCKRSFIFSFDRNNDDVEAKIVKSDVIKSNYAIGLLTSKSSGPIFGNGDLIMSGDNFKTDKMCSCNQKSYQKPIMKSTEKFSIDEYEVFQITVNNRNIKNPLNPLI